MVADHVKPAVDALSIGAVVGTLLNVLPVIAAVLSVVWTLIRIYETDTVQKIIKKLLGRKHDASDPT